MGFIHFLFHSSYIWFCILLFFYSSSSSSSSISLSSDDGGIWKWMYHLFFVCCIKIFNLVDFDCNIASFCISAYFTVQQNKKKTYKKERRKLINLFKKIFIRNFPTRRHWQFIGTCFVLLKDFAVRRRKRGNQIKLRWNNRLYYDLIRSISYVFKNRFVQARKLFENSLLNDRILIHYLSCMKYSNWIITTIWFKFSKYLLVKSEVIVTGNCPFPKWTKQQQQQQQSEA